MPKNGRTNIIHVFRCLQVFLILTFVWNIKSGKLTLHISLMSKTASSKVCSSGNWPWISSRQLLKQLTTCNISKEKASVKLQKRLNKINEQQIMIK